MQNSNQPLPITMINTMKSNTIVVTPLNVALGQPGSQLFQSPAQITPIPQGGSFNLEVPFPIK